MNSSKSRAEARWRQREMDRLGEVVWEEIRLAKLQAAQAREEVIAMLPPENARRLQANQRPETASPATSTEPLPPNVVRLSDYRVARKAKPADLSARATEHLERADVLMRKLWPASYSEAPETTIDNLEHCKMLSDRVWARIGGRPDESA